MKQILLFFVFFIQVDNYLFGQQAPIMVCNASGSTCTPYYNLDSAYKYASPGSYFYIPGGNYSFSDTIKKEVHFYGSGIFADSTIAIGGIAIINTSLAFTSAATGSSIEGLYIRSLYLNAPVAGMNFIMDRCSVSNGDPVSIKTASGMVLITRSVIRTGLTGNNFNNSNILISNCIFRDGEVRASNYGYPALIGYLNGATLKNNYFHSTYDSCINNFQLTGSPTTDMTNCVFKNNIFRSGALGLATTIPGSGNQYYNNIDFPGTSLSTIYPGSTMNSNNRSDSSIGHTFDSLVHIPGCGIYKGNQLKQIEIFNLKVKLTSRGHNGGDDGTDVGIYGGSYPWKAGAVPSNPHIYSRIIGNSTNSSGDLPVNIKVRAEQ